jgi:hypothetical protein
MADGRILERENLRVEMALGMLCERRTFVIYSVHNVIEITLRTPS